MTPIQESELLLPTAEHIREAESLIPCDEKFCPGIFSTHVVECPAHYCSTIALALASRDEKHVTELAVRDARIAALEAQAARVRRSALIEAQVIAAHYGTDVAKRIEGAITQLIEGRL